MNSTLKDSNNSEVALEARQLLLNTSYGLLSTHSVDMQGFPFGSVVPYCLDRTGTPIILISRLAQHCKNVLANPMVSLLVMDDSEPNKHLAGRLTLLCEAKPITHHDVAPRYHSFYPGTKDYQTTLDFDFFRLEIVKARYVGGFGKIHWLSGEQIGKRNPFHEGSETSIVSHMNQDHGDAIEKYCLDRDIEMPQETQAVMVGIDSEGIHVRVGEQLHRISFSREVNDPLEARTILVEMAQA